METSLRREGAARLDRDTQASGPNRVVAYRGRDVPILQLRVPPYGIWVRAFNALLATALFVVLSPLIVAMALTIRLTSRGPAFYHQRRIGRDRRNGSGHGHVPNRRVEDMGGRPFEMYKFRTMTVDAERKTGPAWALPGDSRVTLMGKYLRRLRIDEIPQLWNVVRGDMNIVGPRPERPSLVRYLSEEIDGYALRHRVRPGITGWAQINQAYDTTIQSVCSKLMFDLGYIERRSVTFDLRIMIRTLPAIIRKKGGW